MNSKTKIVLFAGAALLLQAAILMASDPVGIYCIVDKVVFEPNETAPQRVQIWGTFALWEGQPFTGSMQYSAPKKGYLYYTVAPGSKITAERSEWSDLKAIAGTGQGVAFGQRYKPTGRVRLATEKPDSPDVYPLGIGVTKVSHWGDAYDANMKRVIEEIKKAAKP